MTYSPEDAAELKKMIAESIREVMESNSKASVTTNEAIMNMTSPPPVSDDVNKVVGLCFDAIVGGPLDDHNQMTVLMMLRDRVAEFWHDQQNYSIEVSQKNNKRAGYLDDYIARNRTK